MCSFVRVLNDLSVSPTYLRNIPLLDVQKGGQDLFHFEVCRQLFASI